MGDVDVPGPIPRSWLWPLAYLATPFSLYPAGLAAAWVDASRIAARLLTINVKTYSPIAHTYPLSLHGGLDPLDHSIWLPFDEAMMARTDVLLVAHLETWETSKGIAHEVEFFATRKKPIFDLDPDSLSITRRK